VSRACGKHVSGKKRIQGFGGKPKGKRPFGRLRHRWGMGSEWILGRLAGGGVK
jgi:hypothetical protein